jgi:hypothetical protein
MNDVLAVGFVVHLAGFVPEPPLRGAASSALRRVFFSVTR